MALTTQLLPFPLYNTGKVNSCREAYDCLPRASTGCHSPSFLILFKSSQLPTLNSLGWHARPFMTLSLCPFTLHTFIALIHFFSPGMSKGFEVQGENWKPIAVLSFSFHHLFYTKCLSFTISFTQSKTHLLCA